MTKPPSGPYRSTVASHVIDVDDGRPVQPFALVDNLDPTQPHNAALIESGQLVLEDKPTRRRAAAKPDKDGDA